MMARFPLNNIDDLIISSRERIDKTDEYDISYYENYINENIRIIRELIIKVQNQTTSIIDEKTKRRVLNNLRYLLSAYEKSNKKKPRVDFENSPYSKILGIGYLQTHKYSMFIEKDLIDLVQSYSDIIEFMNQIYEFFTNSQNISTFDSYTLWEIFCTTKNSCSMLGIHCPKAECIYDCILNPETMDLGMEYNIDIDKYNLNHLEHDIYITSLPYTVTVPTFSSKGPSKYEISVNRKKPEIYSSESYSKKSSSK